MRRLFLLALCLVSALSLAACKRPASLSADAAQPAPPASPTTVLLGHTWLGLWRDGQVVQRFTSTDWQFNAARLSADSAAIEVAAVPAPSASAGAGAASVLRFDARTLAMLGQASDASAAQWAPMPSPVGTDTPLQPVAPPGLQLATGRALVAANGAALLSAGPGAENSTVLQAHAPDGQPLGAPHALAAGDWRAALAPDGSAVAAFTRGASASGQFWPGVVWLTASGQVVDAPGLSVDDGSARENGAARAVACLLPNGAGAILTYIGAPADRTSEFVSFAPGAGPAVPLDTPYVMTCLSARR